MKYHGNHKRAKLAGEKQYKGKKCKQCKGVMRWTASCCCVICNGQKRTFLADKIEPEDMPLIQALRDDGMHLRILSQKFEVKVEVIQLALRSASGN